MWLTLERGFLIEGNFGEELGNFEEGSVAAEIFFSVWKFLGTAWKCLARFGQQTRERRSHSKVKSQPFKSLILANF